ncbi:MAG: GNAT family N-acetyltransferase [Bacteroidales bacterium]
MITIEPAVRADSRAIAAFQLAMALETEDLRLDPETVTQGVGAVFDDPSKGFYLVAREGNDLVASLMITYEWSDWRAKSVWWIQSLYVLPAYRQQGIFKRMFGWLAVKAKEGGQVGGIRLYVDNRNTRAQQVYEALGMDGDHYRFYELMF